LSSAASKAVEVKVWRLALDERTDTPVVMLQESGGDRLLPIWIGRAEARAIAMELAGKRFPRPLTHDLIKTIIDGLDAVVTKIVIVDLKQNTFYAKIFIEKEDKIVGIDARPSDSIAIALRAGCPIFAAESLLQPQPAPADLSEDERAEALRKYLEDMEPEDFGKSSL